MPAPLQESLRRVRVLSLDSAATRKIEFTGIGNTYSQTPKELAAAATATIDSGFWALVLVAEGDLKETLAALSERQTGYGILVIAKDPQNFIKTSIPNHIVEVAEEKSLRKSPDIYLYRASRTLQLVEEVNHPKVSQKTLEKLNRILIALSAERTPQKLLETILLQAMELTEAQGGTLYMIQEVEGEMYFQLRIRSHSPQNATVEKVEIKVLENSICGYVALTGKISNITNVNHLPTLSLPQLHKGTDHFEQDKTQSILTIPLKNSRNENIAVLQLINKKLGVDFTKNAGRASFFESEDESLLSSFATQASICLENVDLYADIQRLFEGFVKASITAIESRDPSTGGHSERVAKLSVALARATTEVDVGIYRSVKFKEEEVRELEYAALLHDFGKIGVREEVLVKAKKLFPYQLESIRDRVKICRSALRVQYLEKILKNSSQTSELQQELSVKLKELEMSWQAILDANEPSVIKKENLLALEKIRREPLILPDGSQIILLSDEELQALSVPRGSLTEDERMEIESHVRHTFQFLKMIPWTKDFKRLPEIAYAHHEKLDGSGYPRGLSSHEIPLQSKIMTIADIYDALTASDRWYKEAVPLERAIEILGQEVAQGKLDPVLFEIFVQRKVYQATQNQTQPLKRIA